ncbi:adenylosuccinate synthase [Candidatus Gottesmanbacteria bacterium]|nr:adenylosuccinate synthase [Candidatus Gottesmanbacteria bacterium]
MKPTVIIGSQWGDEGKGKLVDALAGKFDVVGRFNGGNNAGHTVIYNGEPCKLHVLPSGIFQKKKLLIAQGAVFDPTVLEQEIEFCNKHRLPLDLLIDYRVNLVMPYHKLMDRANEQWKGKKATGSVTVGIGYCYEDRNNRSGIRCEDLLYPDELIDKLHSIVDLKQAILAKVYGVKEKLNIHKMQRDLLRFGKLFKKYIGDVRGYLEKNLGRKKILFEGAMASMLDGQFGTYPYTVANNTFASSLFTSLGIPEIPLHVTGVVKAYTTRVGGGPFPTEQANEIGSILQTVGKEIAATSGRIRRCGWLDLPVVRFAHSLNRFSELILTKLDVLSVFPKILVCIDYEIKGQTIDRYPSVSYDFYHCRPHYKEFTGWNVPLTGVKKYSDLPQNAKRYIDFLEEQIAVPVTYVSIGPERNQLLRRGHG